MVFAKVWATLFFFKKPFQINRLINGCVFIHKVTAIRDISSQKPTYNITLMSLNLHSIYLTDSSLSNRSLSSRLEIFMRSSETTRER